MALKLFSNRSDSLTLPPVGLPLGPVGPPLGPIGPPLGLVGPALGPAGPTWGPAWSVLGPGNSPGHPSRPISKRGEKHMRSADTNFLDLGSILAPFWSPFGVLFLIFLEHAEKVKIELSPTRELYFEGSGGSKNHIFWTTIWMFF